LLDRTLESLIHRSTWIATPKNSSARCIPTACAVETDYDLLDSGELESGRMEVRRDSVEIMDFIKALASAARQVADDKAALETFVDPAVAVSCRSR